MATTSGMKGINSGKFRFTEVMNPAGSPVTSSYTCTPIAILPGDRPQNESRITNNPIGSNINAASQAALQQAQLAHFELYNLAQDPSEQCDLATQETARRDALVQKLQQVYRHMLAEAPAWEFLEE